MLLKPEEFRLFKGEDFENWVDIQTKVIEPNISEGDFNLFVKRFNDIYSDDFNILTDNQFSIQRYRTNQRATTDDFDFIAIVFDLEGWENISMNDFYNFYDVEGFKINDFVIQWGKMYILYTSNKTVFTNLNGTQREKFIIDFQ